MRVRVQGSGLRVKGSGFRVQGLGFRVQGLGLGFQAEVWGLGFRVRPLGLGTSVWVVATEGFVGLQGFTEEPKPCPFEPEILNPPKP